MTTFKNLFKPSLTRLVSSMLKLQTSLEAHAAQAYADSDQLNEDASELRIKAWDKEREADRASRIAARVASMTE